MIQFLRNNWQMVCIAAVLLAVAVWALLHQPLPAPPLSPAAQKAVEAAVASHQKRAGADTLAARRAAAAAQPAYEAGAAYAGVAKILHQQSKPHAKPTPTDTAAARLQRLLSGY